MDIRIKEIKDLLLNGGIILYPTDTVWGLGCDARNEEAIERIFKLKNRPDSKSLITLVRNEVVIEQIAPDAPEVAFELWESSDKPLTIILDDVKQINPKAKAEDGSAAVRIAKHPFLNRLFEQFRFPLISTSANVSGAPTPRNFNEISAPIKEGVDWICPNLPEFKGTELPSSILKLGNNGDITIIRK